MARIETDDHNGMGIVRIFGEVDISNAEEIGKALEEATGDRRVRHVIDLTATRYFDSAGIRLLFVLATRLQERRQQLSVVAPESGVVRRVLELTDLPRFVSVVSSIDDIPNEPGE